MGADHVGPVLPLRGNRPSRASCWLCRQIGDLHTPQRTAQPIDAYDLSRSRTCQVMRHAAKLGVLNYAFAGRCSLLLRCFAGRGGWLRHARRLSEADGLRSHPYLQRIGTAA